MKAKRKVFSKKFKYSFKDVLRALLSFGFYGLKALRDIHILRKKVKISVSQLNQRISQIEKDFIRDFLLDKFSKLKKQGKNKLCYLILDKTFFPLPEHVGYGYRCFVRKKDKETFLQGEEYSIALAYFPHSDIYHLLDWERIDKKVTMGEFSASQRLLRRIIKNLRSRRMRVRAIIGDKLYFSRKFFEMDGIKDISEGFISKPRSNAQLKEEKLLFKEYPEEFKKGNMFLNDKKYKVYEVEWLRWDDICKIKKKEGVKIGDYRLIMIESELEKKRYYVSNCTHLIEANEIARAYEKYRWKIEYFFQIAKNNFGEYGERKEVDKRNKTLKTE